MKKFKCHECGMDLSMAAEYHLHAFCVLVRAGINPWALVYEAMEMRDETPKKTEFVEADASMRGESDD